MESSATWLEGMQLYIPSTGPVKRLHLYSIEMQEISIELPDAEIL